MGQFPAWLTKQMVSGIRGFNLDAYLVALEGWRRGLTLKWYGDPSAVTDLKIIGFSPLGKTFSLSDYNMTHFFYRSRGDKVTNEAVDIGADKHLTKEHLIKANVPAPKGKSYSQDASIDEIVQDALTIDFPLVVKPTFGSLGKGVTTNIKTEIELKNAIQHVRDIEYDDVVVESFEEGDDYRIYVVGDQVMGAIHRIPANVIGDGQHTIEELINQKNEARKENPYLKTRLIEVEFELINYIKASDYSIESVPRKDETVYLRGAANISGGGDPIEATDALSDEVKRVAVNAIKSIPGLKHAGVDMLVNGDESVVLEVNPTADISMHIFPLKGKAQNVPEAIIDHYFPETKGLAQDRTRIYFDYKEINDLLRKMLFQEYQVTDAPLGKLYAKRYVISGKVQKVGYRNWIRREACRKSLSGYTRNLRNGKVVVVVAGADKNKVNNFKTLCFKGPRRAEVENVEEYIWDKQIKLGFEIRNMNELKNKTKKPKVTVEKKVADTSKTPISARSGSVTLTAVGDILLHGRVYGGLNKKSGYKFSEQLANVEGLLGKTDITVANLESIIAGNEIGLSAFPKFNAPVEIGYKLKDMGVDIVTIANNHVLDRGEEGLLKSIENIEKIGLEYDGAYKSSEDSDRLRVIEKNGLKVAFVSYTRGTNGIKMPKGKHYLVNSLPKTTPLKMAKKLLKIKKDNLADIIIVNLHFGEEYHLNPSSKQKELVATLSDAGADVIIGHHPHVIQPPEWIENSQGMKTLVAYSLGNFFTGQNGLHRQIGAALSLNIKKPTENKLGIVIEKPKYELTFTNRTSRLRYDIHLLRDWVDENKYIETSHGIFNSKDIYQKTKARLRKHIKDLEVI